MGPRTWTKPADCKSTTAEGVGKIGTASSGSKKTLVIVDNSSSNPNGFPKWLTMGGKKPLTTIIADFKPNAMFGKYVTVDVAVILTLNVRKLTQQ